MNLILIAAVFAVCGAAKLERTYLPPASAKTAGGSPGSIQTPFERNSYNDGASNLPKGSFTNDFQGVVVDAASAGTRASGEGETGLGGPRVSYGSTDSRVGEAAFRDAPSFRPFSDQESNEQSQRDGQTASSQVSSEDYNQNRFSPRVESKPERAQAAFDRAANTLRFENEVGPDSYHYAYETDNGISAEEKGVASNGVQAQGGYSYTGDDGLVYTVTYIADEGGYQPRGDHLPTPPPIPEEILKALKKNAKDEAAGLIDDGSYDAVKYNAEGDYAESDSGNIEYNDRQPPKFGKRPESDATASGTFINQNNQAFRPNSNEQLGQGSSEDSRAPTNDFGSSSSEENFGQTAQPNRVYSSNTFDSRKEYLPPNNNFDRKPQRPLAPSGINTPQFNSFNGNDNSQRLTNNGQTQNYQGTQSSSNFGKPGTRLEVLAQSASKENSLESNEFVPSSNNNFAQAGQTSQNSGNTFGSRTEYLPPVNRFDQNGRTQTLRPQRPTASAEVKTTPSFNTFSENTGSFQDNNDASEQSSSSSEFGTGSQSAEQFNGFQQRPQSFNNKYSQNRFQTPQGGQNLNRREQDQSSTFSSTNSQRPTSQPSTELTTPFESNEQTQSSTIGFSTNFDALNSQTNTRPAPQYTRQPNGQLLGSSRPQNQLSVTKTKGSAYSSQVQNQFNRPSFSSKEQSSEETLSENVRDVSDVQFASSTVRPTFDQTQGPDDSYYYRQPSRPFNPPSESRFPGAPSSQFDRVSQQSSQTPGQYSQQSQENTFQTQNYYNPGTIKYPEPPTLAPSTATVSFDKFQGSTPASQYTEASISPFQPLNQGTTKYPRPPTLPPTVPTTQYNGITASSFTSVPTSSFGSRPSYQQPAQFNYQSQFQGSSQFQGTSNQADSKESSSPQVATQQYSGEIYDYSKPPQGLPAPAQKESASAERIQNIPESQPSKSQYDATQGSSNVQEYTQQPTGPAFVARPQLESQSTQFSGQFNSQQQSQDLGPQFTAQSSFKGSQEYQGRPVGVQDNISKCCQSLDARLQPYRGVTQGTGPVPTQSVFGAQFTGPTAQAVSQNSGLGEVFGGPRQPPSFNQDTGYQY